MKAWQNKNLEQVKQQQLDGTFEFCPRCGDKLPKGTAIKNMCLSRRAEIYVCAACGSIEAIEDAGIIPKTGLETWWINERGEQSDNE